MADEDDVSDSVFELGFEPVKLEEYSWHLSLLHFLYNFESINEDTKLYRLPSGRLQDIMKILNEKDVSVLSLDSLIYNDSNARNPEKLSLALRVLQTFLFCLKPSVKTLSLRFNNFPLEAQDYLIDWISQNDCTIFKWCLIQMYDDDDLYFFHRGWDLVHSGNELRPKEKRRT